MAVRRTRRNLLAARRQATLVLTLKGGQDKYLVPLTAADARLMSQHIGPVMFDWHEETKQVADALSFMNAVLAIVDPGEEVIVTSPY